MTGEVSLFAAAFFDRALDGDVEGACEVMEQALDAGVSGRRALMDVLGSALVRVGECWESGACSPAHEHAVTTVAEEALARFSGRYLSREPPPGARSIVLGCVEGERHAIGVKMLSALLRAEGWRVFNLGADTPLGAFVAFVDEHRVEAVGLSAALPDRGSRMRDALVALRAHPGSRYTVIGVGGQGVEAHEESLLDFGADFVAESAEQGIREFMKRVDALRMRKARLASK